MKSRQLTQPFGGTFSDSCANILICRTIEGVPRSSENSPFLLNQTRLIEDEPSDTLAVIRTNMHRAQPYKIRDQNKQKKSLTGPTEPYETIDNLRCQMQIYLMTYPIMDFWSHAM